MAKIRLPGTGRVIDDRRRSDDRRSGLRRSDDMDRRPIALTAGRGIGQELRSQAPDTAEAS